MVHGGVGQGTVIIVCAAGDRAGQRLAASRIAAASGLGFLSVSLTCCLLSGPASADRLVLQLALGRGWGAGEVVEAGVVVGHDFFEAPQSGLGAGAGIGGVRSG